jgi:hypothetical protein
MIAWILGLGFIAAVADCFTGRHLARMSMSDMFSIICMIIGAVWLLDWMFS